MPVDHDVVRPEIALFGLLSSYVLISIGWNLVRIWKGPSLQEQILAARALSQEESAGHGQGD